MSLFRLKELKDSHEILGQTLLKVHIFSFSAGNIFLTTTPDHVLTAGERMVYLVLRTGSAGCVLGWLCGMRKILFSKRGCLDSLEMRVRDP